MITRSGILGMGKAVPKNILTNSDLEKMVDTTDEWIKTRTGIVERRIARDDETTLDLAYEASLEALSAAGVSAEDLDLIIVATVTPDMVFPATACMLQEKIGARKAGAFDLEAGCSGFVYGMIVADQFIRTGVYEKILVVGAETLSKITDWQDRNTCVLFGDGAGAAVMGPVKKGGMLSFDMGSDGSGGKCLDMPAGGSLMPATHETVEKRLHYVRMDGNQVFKFAVKVMGKTALEALKKAELGTEDIDLLIPHQANIRIIESSAKRLKLPDEKVFVNLEKYGNTSSASIPIALYEAKEQNLLKNDQIIVLVGFGAGLTWGAAVLHWIEGES